MVDISWRKSTTVQGIPIEYGFDYGGPWMVIGDEGFETRYLQKFFDVIERAKFDFAQSTKEK